MKKFICLVIGHKNETSQCPVTGAKQTVCLRCFPQTHTREMRFN
jgi:hypothetical protein